MKIRWIRENRTMVDSVATIVMLSIAIVLLVMAGHSYSRSAPPAYAVTEFAVPVETLSLDGAMVAGCQSAPVAVVVYQDFQCEACSSLATKTLPSIWRRYIDSCKLRLAFRNLPIASLHPLSVDAAEAAACAGRQGRFWPMHDLLYRQPERLGSAQLDQLARRLELNWTEFQGCLDSNASLRQIRLDAGEGVTLGVSATPTLFFGTVTVAERVKVVRRVGGALSPEAFEAIVDDLLRVVRSAPPSR